MIEPTQIENIANWDLRQETRFCDGQIFTPKWDDRSRQASLSGSAVEAGQTESVEVYKRCLYRLSHQSKTDQ